MSKPVLPRLPDTHLVELSGVDVNRAFSLLNAGAEALAAAAVRTAAHD